jgi:hypothetical protein
MPTQSSHRDVMISSTTRDLRDYREKAKDAIWRANLFPRMMEADAALPTDPVTYSLDLVAQAEAYVGIFAYRYGFVPDGATVSITEMELREAERRNIPRLIFIIKEDYEVPVNPSNMKDFFETDEARIKQLNDLKADLKSRYVVSFFTDPADLGGKIFESVMKLKESGAFGADAVAETKPAAAAGTLPAPPAPYIAHPYILTRQFFGRKSELKILDDWATSPASTLIFEAIGGMGKSALTWHWMNHHAKERIPNLAGVIWWSFYESDGSLPNFAKHALAYVTGQPTSTYDKVPLPERQRLLVDALRQKPYLLVLDGLERILVAYNTMRAPMKSDDEVDAERQTTDDAHLRSCTDPRHGDFLRALAGCTPSRVLISTRLKPHDLEDKSRQLLPGIAHHSLRGIYPPSEALELLRFLGVKGDGEAILRFTHQFDNHALILQVLAGLVTGYRPAPGDFDTWYEDEGKSLRLSEMDISQRRTGILQTALDGLEAEQEYLLGMVAAFRYPVEYKALAALNPYAPPVPKPVPEPQRDTWYLEHLQRQLKDADNDEERADLAAQITAQEQEIEANYAAAQQVYADYQSAYTAWQARDDLKIAPKRLNTALDRLEDRGLLQWDRQTNRYDLHPVVRAYAFERLTGDKRTQVYQGIRDHFSEQPAEDPAQVNEVDDLRRSLEIYSALIGAGLLDEAASFYKGSLSNVLLLELTASTAVLELLSPLFPQGFAALPALSAPSDQSYFLNEVSIALSNLGREVDSLAAIGLTLRIDLEREDASELGVRLNNYGASLSSLNRLAERARTTDLALRLAQAAEDTDGIAFARHYQLGFARGRGDWAAAETAYQAYQAAPVKNHFQAAQAAARVALVYAMIAIQQQQPAADRLTEARRLVLLARNRRTQAMIEDWWGEEALNQGDWAGAAGHFQEALTGYRKMNQPTAGVCLRLALTCARQGDAPGARDWLEQAGVRATTDDPIQRQSLIDAAEAYHALGDGESCKAVLLPAYQWAWADGPPYVNWWKLERCRKLIAALGLDEAAIQQQLGCTPFDESKVEKIPYEDEIVALIERLEQAKAKRVAQPPDGDEEP